MIFDNNKKSTKKAKQSSVREHNDLSSKSAESVILS